MSSLPEPDPRKDPLLAPNNAALLIIDYQPVQVNSVNSMPRADLIRNITLVARMAKIYELPVILSTVNVRTGQNNDTIPALREELENIKSYDRTSINAWEDRAFHEAVQAAGRKKLIMTALWTEACLTFPALAALKEGYEVFPVVDAVGGTSILAHKTALRRMEQAGASLVSLAQLACELQRDWDRKETVGAFVGIMQDAGIFLNLS